MNNNINSNKIAFVLSQLSKGVGDAGSSAWPAQQLSLWPEHG